MKPKYVIISPCRNEEKFMEKTLESIIKQTFPPDLWLIVDDGSTDNTPDILARYSAKYPWIKVVTRTDRGHRAVGPGVIEAFYAGYDLVDTNEFQYFCKLDLDLVLPESYFEILISRMEKHDVIGTCSGKSYLERDGVLLSERMADETSIGASKLYRIKCFEDIGGFVRNLNWDGIDCHLCRMKGWVACSWDEPDLRFIHLRPMGSSHVNIYHGKMRQGYGQYYTGSSIWYMLAVAIYRSIDKPYVTGSLVMLWSYIKSAVSREPRYGSKEFRKFVRKFQWTALLKGKQYAIAKIYQDKGIPWPLY